MKKNMVKAALLICFVGLVAAQTEQASASVDWSWSFEPSDVLMPLNATEINVSATVVNSPQSTEDLYVYGILGGDGSMGYLLYDSQGSGALVPTVPPLTEMRVGPGESMTATLFTLVALDAPEQPLVLGEEYFAAPLLYAGACDWGCGVEQKLPATPLHITISAVPEPSLGGLWSLGLLAVRLRASRSKLRATPAPEK